MAGLEPQPLGSRALVIAGQSPDGKYYNSSRLGLPFYQGKKDFGERELQPPTVWTSQTTKEAQAGDILMSVRAPVGPINFAREAVCIGRGLAAIRCRDGLEQNFLFYQLLGMQADIAGKEGAVFASINKAEIEALPIVVPALPEQRRIVAILDEAVEGIATAKANAEKNLQNARELFDGYLQAVYTQDGPDWVAMTLGDVCDLENGDRGKNYPNRNEYVETGIPWINTGHIRPDGTLSMEEMNFITREKFKSLRGGKIRAGDLVYCLRGATLGKTALVAPLTEGAVASSLVIVRPSLSLDSRFLYFFLTSPPGQGLIAGFENGAAQPNLGARSVAKYPIPVPPLAEQKRVVETITEIREQTQRLAGLHKRKLAALDELKKSLLHQAFTGALTAKSTDRQVAEVA